MEVFINALAEGSVWAVMGLGIFISFRILNAPDMTTEGSFTLGAGLGGQAMCFGFHPVVALGIAFLAGMAAGAITGLLTTRLKLNPLLSGIITMTGLYSIKEWKCWATCWLMALLPVQEFWWLIVMVMRISRWG